MIGEGDLRRAIAELRTVLEGAGDGLPRDRPEDYLLIAARMAEPLGLDYRHAQEFAYETAQGRNNRDVTEVAAGIQLGICVGILAGRRDAAECMEIPA